MSMANNMQWFNDVQNNGLSRNKGVAVLKPILSNKENVDSNGPPRQAVGALLSAVQASLVDLKHEVAAAKTLSNTATIVLQSAKSKNQHDAIPPDGLEGHNQKLSTWLAIGVALAEAVHMGRAGTTAVRAAKATDEVSLQEPNGRVNELPGSTSQKLPGPAEQEVRIAALEAQLAELLSRQQQAAGPPLHCDRRLMDALDCEAVRAEDLNSFLARLAVTEEKLESLATVSAQFDEVQDDLAICKAHAGQSEETAQDAQGLSQSMQMLEDQVSQMGKKLDEANAAMRRLTAQQAANNHSMAVVASQQVELQSRMDTFKKNQAQAEENTPALSCLLGRLQELEAQQNAGKVTIADLETSQADLKQAWTDAQGAAARQDAAEQRFNQLEMELSAARQQGIEARELASRIEKQQEDVREELRNQLAVLLTITEQQAALHSSIAALDAAHAALAADTRRDAASTGLMKLDEKVAEVASYLQALAAKAASPEAAPAAKVSTQEPELQHFVQELAAVKAQGEQLSLAVSSEASKFGAALAGLSAAQSSTAAKVDACQVELACAAEELQQLGTAVKEAEAAARESRQHAGGCVEGLQAQVGAWRASMEALAADHELAAEETGAALKTLARLNADGRAMQHAQLEIAADCASHQAAIAQLQAVSDSTAETMGALTARLDAVEAMEGSSRDGIGDEVARLEASAAQASKQLAAAEQQADARIRRQEAELHLLQETVVELGTAVHASESSEAAWGDSLASVQAELEHTQQSVDQSIQQMSEALHTDLTRYAGCLSQARAVLSDHAQQLGRLSELPAQVAGLSKELLSIQQTLPKMRTELDSLAALPEQVEQVSDKQGAAMKQLASTSGRQMQGVQAELESVNAQASAIAQKCEALGDLGSRIEAAELHLEGIVQVQRTVSNLEGRIRIVECTVADALEEEAAQMLALQEALAKQATRMAAFGAAGTPQNSQDTASSATTVQVAAQTASSLASAQPASSLPSAAERGRQQRQRLQFFAQRSRASRKSGSQES